MPTLSQYSPVKGNPHLHSLHELGNASTVANYHDYYQLLPYHFLFKNGTANQAASNTHYTPSYVLHCQNELHHYDIQNGTRTLHNQKHEVLRFKCLINLICQVPPLPTTRQCPNYFLGVPKHANMEYGR